MNASTLLGALGEGSADWPAAYLPDGSVRTRQQLLGLVMAMSRYLAEQGVKAGDLVGMRYPATERYLVLALAIARLGAVSAPVGDEQPSPQVVSRWAQQGLQFVLGFTGGQWPLETSTVKLIEFPDHAVLQRCAAETATEMAADAEIFRRTTSSGTSGRPKPVSLSHAAQFARLQQRHRSMPMRSGQKILIAMGLDAEVTMTYALYALSRGVAWVFPRSYEPDDFLEALLAHRPDYVLSSPYRWQAVAAQAKQADRVPEDLKPTVFLAGGRIDPELIQHSRERLNARILSDYGSSETGMLALVDAESIPPQVSFVGKLLPDVECTTLDPATHQPLPAGKPGLLAFKAPGMVSGYAGDPASTDAYFRDGWFVPGDLGRLDEHQQLWVQGRASKVINRAGVKLDLEQLTLKFNAHGEVEDSAWLDIRTPKTHYLIAVVQTSIPQEKHKALIEALAAGLKDFERPDHMVLAAKLPRTESGKVDIPKLSESIARRLDLQ